MNIDLSGDELRIELTILVAYSTSSHEHRLRIMLIVELSYVTESVVDLTKILALHIFSHITITVDQINHMIMSSSKIIRNLISLICCIISITSFLVSIEAN